MRASISPPRMLRQPGVLAAAGDERDGAHRRGRGGRPVAEFRSREPQQRHVGRGIAAGELGGGGGAIGEQHAELVLAGQRLVGGDDEAGAPDQAADAPAVGAVDGDEAGRGRGDESGELVGEGGKIGWHCGLLGTVWLKAGPAEGC